MQKKRDIYHQDQVPSLARKKSGRRKPPVPGEEILEEQRMASSGQALPTPSERVPFDGYHPDGHSPPRKRRRRRKTPEPENRVRLYLVLGLLSLLLIYAGIWVLFKVFGGNRETPAPAPKAGVEEPAPEEEAPAPPPVNVFELIQNIRTADRAIESAARLSDREDYPGAVQQLGSTLEKLPHHQLTLMALARTHYRAKDYDAAITAAYQVLSSNPDNQPARLLMGEALGKSRRYKEAIEVADWVLTADPYSAEGHLLAATCHKALEQAPRAIPHLRKAYSMKPEDALIGNELALAYADTGNFGRALDVFETLMAESRVDSVTYFNLATCYAQKNMPEKVVETLLRAGERFGMGYISSWIQSEKFDSIREDPNFKELGELGTTDSEPPEAPSS